MLIGEVAQQSGISARMLRHYDRIGLVRPTERTASGYREYDEADIRRLFHVEGLRSLGLSLHEIGEVLEDLSFSPAAMVDQLIAGTRDRLVREQELLDRLDRVRASDPTAWSDVLQTIGLIRGLDAPDPMERQRFALSLTGESPQHATPLAEAALAESELNVAATLDWALARTGERAIPVLVAALDSPSPERRRRAVAALTKIGSPRATAALADAFQHEDPLVSTSAVLARGGLGHADAIGAPIDLVADGRSDVDAADGLGVLASQHGHADAIAEAIAVELGRGDEAARQRLVAALADVPGTAARQLLVALTADADPRVRHTATFLLRRR